MASARALVFQGRDAPIRWILATGTIRSTGSTALQYRLLQSLRSLSKTKSARCHTHHAAQRDKCRAARKPECKPCSNSDVEGVRARV